MDTRPLRRALQMRDDPESTRLVLVPATAAIRSGQHRARSAEPAQDARQNLDHASGPDADENSESTSTQGTSASAETASGAAPEPAGLGWRGRIRGAFRGGAPKPQVVTVLYRCEPEDEISAVDLLELLAHVGSVAVAQNRASSEAPAAVVYGEHVAAMCGRPGAVAVVAVGEVAGAEEIDLTHRPVSRRALLGAAATDIPEAAATPQRRLVEAVNRLLPAGDRVASLEAAPGPAPHTGSPRLRATGCSADGLCERVCPHGALRLEVTELTAESEAASTGPAPTAPAGQSTPRSTVRAPRPASGAHRQFRLWHSPVDCSDCGRCVEMCPNDALSRSGEHSWTDLLEALPADGAGPAVMRPLRAGLVRPCKRCGASHARPGDLCRTCEATVANPFSVRLPPGFALPPPLGP